MARDGHGGVEGTDSEPNPTAGETERAKKDVGETKDTTKEHQAPKKEQTAEETKNAEPMEEDEEEASSKELEAGFGDEPASTLAFEVGADVEAKFEGKDRWFDAKVIKVGETTVTVKWGYDDDVPETEVPKADVRLVPKTEEAENPEDVLAKTGSAVFNSGHILVSWLLERPNNRVSWLERISGADVAVSEDDGTAKMMLREGEVGGGAQWAAHCVHAICALRNGQSVHVCPLPEPTTWNPPLSVVKVPKQDAKGYVLGKAGARLLQLSDDCDVVSVFANEAQMPEASAEEEDTALVIEVGSKVEAKFGSKGRWFDAKIVEVLTDTVKVKWDYDDDEPETEVAKDDLRATKNTNENSESNPAFEVGMQVEAQFGDSERWFVAKITEVGQANVKVKWDYDDEEPETEVEKSKVKVQPFVECENLHIYGDMRARKTMQVKVLNLLENRLPGFVTSNLPQPDDTDEVGLSVEPLLNDGELKGKVIGKGGSVRLRTGSACSSSLEFIGNVAVIIGTGLERRRTAELLKLIQTSANGSIEKVPDLLEPICTRVLVPSDASAVVIGKKRATMNQIEDDTGTLTFWVPSATPNAGEKKKLEITEGMTMEGKHKGRWFECTVLDTTKKTQHGNRAVKVRWDYDENETSELELFEIRELLEGEDKLKRDRLDALADSRTLAIFGPERPRIMCELHVMNSVETKLPDHYKTCGIRAPGESDDAGELGIEALNLDAKETQRAKDHLRSSVATAAHCIIEPVGECLYVAGNASERARGLEYLKWLAMESLSVTDANERTDLDQLMVPEDKMANLTLAARRVVEKATETLTLFDDGASLVGIEKCQRLLIIGHSEANRKAALAKLKLLQDKTLEEESSWVDKKDWPDKQEFGGKRRCGEDSKKQGWGGDKKGSWGDDAKKQDFGGEKKKSWAGDDARSWGQAKSSWAEEKQSGWVAEKKSSWGDKQSFGKDDGMQSWGGKRKISWAQDDGDDDDTYAKKKNNWGFSGGKQGWSEKGDQYADRSCWDQARTSRRDDCHDWRSARDRSRSAERGAGRRTQEGYGPSRREDRRFNDPRERVCDERRQQELRRQDIPRYREDIGDRRREERRYNDSGLPPLSDFVADDRRDCHRYQEDDARNRNRQEERRYQRPAGCDRRARDDSELAAPGRRYQDVAVNSREVRGHTEVAGERQRDARRYQEPTGNRPDVRRCREEPMEREREPPRYRMEERERQRDGRRDQAHMDGRQGGGRMDGRGGGCRQDDGRRR